MTSGERIEGFNCAKCGAPLDNPYSCTYCGAQYRQRDDDPAFIAAHPEPFALQKKIYIAIITASSLSLSILALFFGPYLPGYARALLLFVGIPVLVAGIAAALAADFLSLEREKPEEQDLRKVFFTWLTEKRLTWFAIKPVLIATPLYLFQVRRPVLYAVAGFFLGTILVGVLVFFVTGSPLSE